jgi:hypothetical protein
MLLSLSLVSACRNPNTNHTPVCAPFSTNSNLRLTIRVRRLCVLAATTALLAVACLPAPSSASVEWVVQQVQVLHRHGARSAVPSYNTTAICGATPCGYLNPEGEQMMLNVGSFLRQRYNHDTTVVDEPFISSENYNLDVVSSRSTDMLRTMQSADLLLAGLFPNRSRLIPVVHTTVYDEDMLLNTYAQPWVTLYGSYATSAQLARMNPIVDAHFPNFADLTALGASLSSEGYCSDYTTRWNCASMLWDIAAAKKSIGALPPLAATHYKDLQETMAAYYRYMWYYNESDEFVVQQGGRGQPFLEQVVKNINNFLAGTNKFKVMHYSAHDTTLGPVWGTLGDSSINGVLPPYSQILVLELVKHATNGTYAVRVLRGWPGQSPDTNFTFSWDPAWQLQCRNSAGAKYNATDNMCLVADFQRYVQSTAGTSPQGMCLLNSEVKEMLNCPALSEELAGTAKLSVSCAWYRGLCPAYSCESGYVLNAANSLCSCNSASCFAAGSANTPVAVTVHLSGVSSGATAGIAIATFAVGAILAAAVTMLLVTLLRRRRPTYTQKYYADGRPLHDNDGV